MAGRQPVQLYWSWVSHNAKADRLLSGGTSGHVIGSTVGEIVVDLGAASPKTKVDILLGCSDDRMISGTCRSPTSPGLTFPVGRQIHALRRLGTTCSLATAADLVCTVCPYAQAEVILTRLCLLQKLVQAGCIEMVLSAMCTSRDQALKVDIFV